MSGHVASQTNGLPCFHGTMVTPSGHLPSERSRPDRFNLDGILADDRARYRTSLMAMMATLTFLTAQAMSGKVVHISPTMLASMGTA